MTWGRSLIKNSEVASTVKYQEPLVNYRSQNTAPLTVISPVTAKADTFANENRIQCSRH